jgi:uncharacterized protein YbaP (TraB family)
VNSACGEQTVSGTKAGSISLLVIGWQRDTGSYLIPTHHASMNRVANLPMLMINALGQSADLAIELAAAMLLRLRHINGY